MGVQPVPIKAPDENGGRAVVHAHVDALELERPRFGERDGREPDVAEDPRDQGIRGGGWPRNTGVKFLTWP